MATRAEAGLLVAALGTLTTVCLAAQAGPSQRQVVDEAAAGRGKSVYAFYCINCHGSTAKGTERGPDLIRSAVVLRDRLGNAIGPAIKQSATHQASSPSAQVVDLSHFLHQRVEATASNRNADGANQRAHRRSRSRARVLQRGGQVQHVPLADGRPRGHRDANCRTRSTCSSDSSFPRCAATGQAGGGHRDAAVADRPCRERSCASTTSSCRCATRPANTARSTRGPGVRVDVRDPLAAHHELLDRYTDADMHNLTDLPGDVEMKS